MGTIMSRLLAPTQLRQHENILKNCKEDKPNYYSHKISYKKYGFGLGIIIIIGSTYSYFKNN